MLGLCALLTVRNDPPEIQASTYISKEIYMPMSVCSLMWSLSKTEGREMGKVAEDPSVI